MHSRFAYEVPSFVQKATATLTAPHRWRSHGKPSIFDRRTVILFRLSRDEEVALRPVTRRMTNGATPIPIVVAFDHAACALLDRRLGYSSEWERLSRRTPADWESCL